MLFTHPIFLYVFLPLILSCYFLSPKKLKNSVLLLFSLFFYAFGEQKFIILIIASAVVDFFCGLIISKNHKKAGLYLSIIFNLSILFYFKYSDFFYSNLSYGFPFLDLDTNKFASVGLPIGISFFTFQTMSYTIDVYRGKVKASSNFINFLTYVSFFPQLIAGPIVRYSEVEKQLKKRSITLNSFYNGAERFIIGLSKKLLIANNCAYIADNIFNLPENEISMLTAWIGAIAYALQIYFDFSGYSDMAIGLGKLFGFNFPENFNLPYTSKSIKEFWQRWHITLSRWFKDYVYIPLGGNRVSKNRTYLNLIIVFIATGFWHGANWTFIAWGFWHGGFLILEKIFLEKKLNGMPKIISHFYCLFIVLIGWVIFRSHTILDAKHFIINLFNFKKPVNIELLYYYLNKESIIAICFGILFSLPISKYFKKSKTLYKFKPFVLILLLIICSFYVAAGTYNPFIYFRF